MDKETQRNLIEEYREHNITTCEGRLINPNCMRTFALSFHHLERRSTGRAEDTFEGTRLLCADCHFRADSAPGYQEFNERLKGLR